MDGDSFRVIILLSTSSSSEVMRRGTRTRLEMDEGTEKELRGSC